MDQSAFYGVVAAINFTLLGLWWVEVKDRSSLVDYLVSLQFVIPGTISLLSQVAPDIVLIWRTAFAIAGALGAVSVVMLARELRQTTDFRVAPALFLAFGVPVYLAIVLVATMPSINELLPGATLKPIQIEAILVSLLVFLGVQEAWVASMTPEREQVEVPTPPA